MVVEIGVLFQQALSVVIILTFLLLIVSKHRNQSVFELLKDIMDFWKGRKDKMAVKERFEGGVNEFRR